MQAFVAGVEYKDREMLTPEVIAARADAEQSKTRVAEIDQQLGIKRPTFLACAKTGYNVFATLDATTQAVLKGFHLKKARRGSDGKARSKSERIAV